MATHTTNLLYLGHLPVVDTVETPWTYHAENADALLGTYTHNDIEVVSVDLHDTDGGNSIHVDADQTPNPGETITFDVGGTPTTEMVDAIVAYDVQYHIGATTQAATAYVVQTVNGHTFLYGTSGVPPQFHSVTLLTSGSSGFGGFSVNANMSPDVKCFTRGTQILTPYGARPIEDLRSGDVVTTHDGSAHELLWVGASTYQVNQSVAPYVLERGALGGGLPRARLVVSRQHRIMVQSPIAKRMVGAQSVLVPVCKMDAVPGVYQTTPSTYLQSRVQYWHLVFADHRVVIANGTPCESMRIPVELLPKLPRQSIGSLVQLLHDVVESQKQGAELMAPALPIVENARALQLVSRHIKNGKPLLPIDFSPFGQDDHDMRA